MDQRPNIIFIITDQQRFDTINALGFPHMETPHLDRLVKEGVTFTNCHVTAASCAPCRASLFTGYYPHTTGILRNADSWTRSWIEDVAESGYKCINVGKMHTYPYHTQLGFHERYVVENKDRYMEERWYFDEWDKALKARGLVKQQREFYRKRDDYKDALGSFLWELPSDMHSDNFVGDTATWWLDTKPKVDEPLFLEIGFPGPHPPYDPTPEYAERYINKEIPLQEIKQSDLDGQPPPLKGLRVHNNEIDHDSVVLPLDPTPEQRHKQRAYYDANVTMIDDQVGAIMDSLERNGYLENSVVIFTSDHGDCLTDHGHSQKWTMYEQVTKVPLIVWSPKLFGDQAGQKIDGLCSLFDIGPAILELAGVEPASDIEAESVLPALRGEDWTPRSHVYCEQARDMILTDTEFMTMVRSDTHKLVHFMGEPWGQLFNLVEDPDEFENLWDDPGSASVKQELLDNLREWRMQSAYNTKDWAAGSR